MLLVILNIFLVQRQHLVAHPFPVHEVSNIPHLFLRLNKRMIHVFEVQIFWHAENAIWDAPADLSQTKF